MTSRMGSQTTRKMTTRKTTRTMAILSDVLQNRRMTPARDPKPGWAYRTGSDGGSPELRNSKFSDVRQNHRKINFPIGFLKNPSLESAAGEHTQLFTEGFPVIFHEGPLSSWNRRFSCWLYVPISNSEPNVCPRMAYSCLGVAWKDAWCPWALIWFCDLMISWHDMIMWSYYIAIWSYNIAILSKNVIWSCNIVIWS